MNLYLTFFKTFFKIGLFTLGGGYAMIPIIEKEVVDNYNWIKREDFIDIIAIAQSCPGVLAINMSVFIGYRLKKLPGALVTCLATALPSFIIILLIAMFFHQFEYNKVVEAMFRGIRPAVVALILSPVFTTAKSAKISWKNAWIPIAISLLIWSNIPVVSSPILYILIGGLFGYFIYSKNFRTAVEKQEGDKQ